jgi:hypothetical protein
VEQPAGHRGVFFGRVQGFDPLDDQAVLLLRDTYVATMADLGVTTGMAVETRAAWSAPWRLPARSQEGRVTAG